MKTNYIDCDLCCVCGFFFFFSLIKYDLTYQKESRASAACFN